MEKRYSKTLSQGTNNTVVALSATEVAKLFTDDTRSDIGSEAEKMQYANRINALVVKFIVGEKLLAMHVAQEQKELEAFKQYYLYR